MSSSLVTQNSKARLKVAAGLAILLQKENTSLLTSFEGLFELAYGYRMVGCTKSGKTAFKMVLADL